MKSPLPSRTCPECGVTFTPTWHRAWFCQVEHQKAFGHRNATRGKVLLPLAQAMRLGKRGFNEDRRFALREFAILVDRYNREDREAGRRPDLVVSRKRASLWSAADLA